jgi:hypothetical protein
VTERPALKVGDRTKVRGVRYLVVGIKSSRNLGSSFWGKGRVYLRDADGNEVSVYCNVPAKNIANCKPNPVKEYEQEFVTLKTGKP